MSYVLELSNIYKTYGTRDVLKGVSIRLSPGEIVSLLGVNGAGKTTLFSIIATLHPATKGEVLFEGTSVYNQLTFYRTQLGFCPQKPNFEPQFTIYEHLLFAGRYYGLPKEACIKRAHELLTQFGLETYKNEKPDILSGGYRQRLLLARSLVHKPKILLLDEPTVGMDPHIRRELWESIKQIKSSGVAIFITTHYLDEAEILSDRVCIIDQGIIQKIDTPQNLIAAAKTKNLEDLFVQFIQDQACTHEVK